MLLGIDTGGTYTDAVLYTARRGVLASAKSPTTHADLGMQLMDDHLMRLVERGIVSPSAALLKALDKSAFRELLDAHVVGGEAPLDLAAAEAE